jgi:polyisoprenoid-binding protein YceI
MNRLVLALITLSLLLVPVAGSAATWDIDATHSNVGFKVRHFFSNVPGQFNTFAGTIDFDPAQPEAGSVEVLIEASSVDTDNEKRDAHLQSEDFFWAEEHPELHFRSTKVEAKDDGSLLVTGLLSMRGVQKEVVLEAEFLGAGPDSWGGTRAGFTASTQVNRKEWGIVWNKALDHGGAMLGDDVTIQLDIQAVLQQESTVE